MTRPASHAALNDGVSVKDFGASADGSQDDSPAIQAALDSGHDLVLIPYGVYQIGRTL